MPEGIWNKLSLGNNPTIQDILLFGIKSEKESALLYKRFATNISNKLAKNKFENLVLDEEYHAQELEEAYKRIVGRKLAPMKISVAFLSEEPIEEMSLIEALRYAIENEARARKFYLAMAERAKNENARHMFQYFAQTEHSHQKALEAELHFIKSEGDNKNPWTFKKL